MKDYAIAQMVQALGGRYVRYINYAYKCTGTLWEGRYKASLVHDDQYLLACQRYIELNPVRSGIVPGPGDYPYSSFAHNALGNVYMAAGQETRAIEQFRTAIELDPEKIEAWYNLGFVADKLGKREEAVYAYRGFLERAPASLQQHVERARARVEALSGEAGR